MLLPPTGGPPPEGGPGSGSGRPDTARNHAVLPRRPDVRSVQLMAKTKPGRFHACSDGTIVEPCSFKRANLSQFVPNFSCPALWVFLSCLCRSMRQQSSRTLTSWVGANFNARAKAGSEAFELFMSAHAQLVTTRHTQAGDSAGKLRFGDPRGMK